MVHELCLLAQRGRQRLHRKLAEEARGIALLQRLRAEEHLACGGRLGVIE